MDREETITRIFKKYAMPTLNPFFFEILKVLEQEPCREQDDYENEIEDLHNRLDIAEYDKERLREEVTNLETQIKALEQEPCEDCISRKDTIDWLKQVTVTDGITFETGFKQILHDIEQMPSVKQEPKTGHWIDIHEHHYYNDGDIETTELRCSRCNETVEWDIELLHKPYYCENCGARMSEVEQ